MMQDKFEDHIKKQFGDYRPEVPPHIWENITAKKDRKKPAGFWLGSLNLSSLSAILLILATIGTGIYLYNTRDIVPANNTIPPFAGQPAFTTKQPVGGNQPVNEGTPTPVPATASTSLQPSSPAFATTGLGSQNTGYTHGNTRGTVAGNKTVNGATIFSSTGEPAVPGNFNLNDIFLRESFLYLDKLSAGKATLQLKKTYTPPLPIPCPTAEDNAAGNKKYVELYAGPDYAIRSFSDTGNSAYLQKRKESTKTSLAFSAGIRYTRVFNNGMSIRTGFNYSQVNEKFTYKQGNTIQVIYITNNNGDTTGSYTQTGTRYKTSTNKYRTVDIPLVIGYELGNGNLHANINAGAMVNLYSWQKGSQVDTANNIIDISTGKDNSPYQFRTNIGVGFVGALSVYYKLNEQLHLLAEPYYRYNFSPATKSEMTFKQKYNSAGLRLGVRVDF